MANLDNAINGINAAADRANATTDFYDDILTGDELSNFVNPNNSVSTPTIAKQIKEKVTSDTYVSQAIKNAGWDVVGDFADLPQVNDVNDVLSSKSVTGHEDALWRTNQTLPYTPTGTDPTQAPELGKWVAVAQGELKSIARSLNVADSAVIYSTDTVTLLDNVQYIYDAPTQTTWGKPNGVGVGETITDVTGSDLTTTGGSYTLKTVTADENDRLVTLETDIADHEARIADNETDIADLFEGQTAGVIVFSTYALLDAYTPAAAQEQGSFKVTNDPDSSLNGYYSWVSGTAYTKDADLVVNTIDAENTSDAVSGAAVYNHTFLHGTYQGAADGNYFPFKDTYMSNTGVYASLTGYQCSYYIPIKQTDIMVVTGMEKGGAFDHATFFDVNKVFISVLSVGSLDASMQLDSSNIPVNTAFVVINSSDGKEPDQSVTKNGISLFESSILNAEDRLQSLEVLSPVGTGIVDGAYKSNLDGYYINKNTGKLVPFATLSLTHFIPLTSSDTLYAENTTKSTSLDNVNFFDKDKVFISSLNVASVPNIVDLNSGNIPVDTAYVVLSHITGSPVYVKVNGVDTVINRVGTLESNLSSLTEDLDLRKVDGDYFTVQGYYRNNTTGALVANAAFATTELIPFTVTDYMYAFGTSKSGSLSNINFYDANKAFLGAYNLASTTPKLIVDPLFNNLAPAGTEYITLNTYPAGTSRTEVVINGISSTHDLSKQLVRNYLTNKHFTFFGDSITALTTWEQMTSRLTQINATIRGIGSSAMASAGPTQVAVEPDGMYIDRRANYGSDTDYTNALAAKGFTILVTSPTWLEYSSDPTSYTLDPGSYFDITSQASNQERINTLPTNSHVVSVMFGTNDDKANVGTIDSYDDGTFIGEYRLCLDLIKARCPNAVIVVCIPTRNSQEYDTGTKTRTTYGIGFSNMRDKIREMCNEYGFYVIDFSTIINYSNTGSFLADGVHPNTDGQRLMSRKYALEVSRLALSDIA